MQPKRLKDGRKIPAAEVSSVAIVPLPMYAYYAEFCAKCKEGYEKDIFEIYQGRDLFYCIVYNGIEKLS